jgi:hypothetical protein
VLEEPKVQKPFELFPWVDPRPEIPEERLNRTPPEKRSVSALVKVEEGVDRILGRTRLSRISRDRIRKAARSAVIEAAEERSIRFWISRVSVIRRKQRSGTR